MRSRILIAVIAGPCILSLVARDGRADAPYSNGFESDAVGAMPAGWTDISGGPQMVVATPTRSGVRSFYQSAPGLTTEAHHAWTPAPGVPWTMSFSLLISGNSTQDSGCTVAFGLYGPDTWGATGTYIGWNGSGWELRGMGTPAVPVQADRWYDILAKFNGGDVMTGRADWYVDGVQVGFGELAAVQGSDTYLLFGTDADAGESTFGFVDDISVGQVPEPATMGLLAVGLVGLAGLRRRR